jgi:DNA-binding SARP family transcriptional activator/sugar lactone lactonase YvrE
MTERLTVEANGTKVDEQRFPGRQGRIVFAYLAVQNGRAVPRGELAEVLWGEELPATWEKGLRVLMTKLRALLEECGIDRSTGLTSAFGCYTLTLPTDAWIDVEAAVSALEQAESALAAGDLDEARAQASKAAALSRSTFLPGEDGQWVEGQRRDLRGVLVSALECLRDVSLAAGEFGDAVRYAAEIIDLEPFRESNYRALMQAHVEAGNTAEALRVYERLRRFLADELGAYPSEETEAVYLEILRSSSRTTTAAVERAGEDPVEAGSPPPPVDEPRWRRRRWAVALAAGALLVVVLATAAGLVFGLRDKPAVRILPNSLVRLDSETLKPTLDVPIGRMADLVVATHGYVWVNHWSLRFKNDSTIRNAGDRGLTRVNASTGEAQPVQGGLAPCGITADVSGDLWVSNCYPAGIDGRVSGSVQRVHADTMELDPAVDVPTVDGYYRGMAYGGGFLWLAGVSGDTVDRRLIRFDPQTGKRRTIHMDRHATALAWSPKSGELWMSNCDNGTVSRMHAGKVTTPFEYVSGSPCPVAVGDDGATWVGDWEASPSRVTRLPADGSGLPQGISLPRSKFGPGGVVSIAAGAGGIWVAVPDDHAVWRIDPLHPTRPPKRIFLGYAPWGVAVDDNGAIWVTLRGTSTYKHLG